MVQGSELVGCGRKFGLQEAWPKSAAGHNRTQH